MPEYREVSQTNPPPGWENRKSYMKKVLTSAVRVNEPVIVLTSEGPLTCEDGYVAQDSRGYFYPIDATEFETIYVEAVGEDPAVVVED